MGLSYCFDDIAIDTLRDLCAVDKYGCKYKAQGKDLHAFLVAVAVLYHLGLRMHLPKYEYVIYQMF